MPLVGKGGEGRGAGRLQGGERERERSGGGGGEKRDSSRYKGRGWGRWRVTWSKKRLLVARPEIPMNEIKSKSARSRSLLLLLDPFHVHIQHLPTHVYPGELGQARPQANHPIGSTKHIRRCNPPIPIPTRSSSSSIYYIFSH